MEFSASLILLILTAFFIYVFLRRKQTYWSRNGIAQLNHSIIFGDAKELILGTKSQAAFFLDLYQKCKALHLKEVGIYFGFIPAYVPVDLDVIKLILVKDFPYFGGRGLFHHEEDLLTENLFSIDGEKWKNRRYKLSPLFTTGKLKKMFQTVLENGTKMNEIISNYEKSNELFDVKDLAARFTTDNIANLVFGLDSNTLHHPNAEIREMGRILMAPAPLKRSIELLFQPNFLVKLGYRMFPPVLYSYFTRVVKDTIDYREKTKFQSSDFMQLMIELKNQGKLSEDNEQVQGNSVDLYLSMDEIISEAFMMYFGGFETSSSTTTFAAYELAQNQYIQDKLRDEIIKEIEKENGNITYDSVMKMEYLDKVVKETLRKYPILPVITRECLKDYKFENSNRVIEKGTRIMIPVIGLHKDSKYFRNPDEFNPENFSPENIAARPSHCYIPFGDGPRLCLGMRFGLLQSKMALISLVKDFRFTLDETYQHATDFDAGSFTLAFKGEMPIRVTRHNNCNQVQKD